MIRDGCGVDEGRGEDMLGVVTYCTVGVRMVGLSGCGCTCGWWDCGVYTGGKGGKRRGNT